MAWAKGCIRPSDTLVSTRVGSCSDLHASVLVVSDGEVEFSVDGFAVFGASPCEDVDDSLELVDDRFDLCGGEAVGAGAWLECEFGGSAGESDFFDPFGDDGWVGAGFDGLAVLCESASSSRTIQVASRAWVTLPTATTQGSCCRH